MSYTQTFYQQQGKQLREKAKTDYAQMIESLKEKGVGTESLDLLAAVEQKTHHYHWSVNSAELGGNMCLANEYPQVKISERKLKQIETIVTEENLILHPSGTDFGFPLLFNVLYGEELPSGRKIIHRLLSFHQYQTPPSYNVDIMSALERLKPSLLRQGNKELIDRFGLEPIDETGAAYFY